MWPDVRHEEKREGKKKNKVGRAVPYVDAYQIVMLRRERGKTEYRGHPPELRAHRGEKRKKKKSKITRAPAAALHSASDLDNPENGGRRE